MGSETRGLTMNVPLFPRLPPAREAQAGRFWFACVDRGPDNARRCQTFPAIGDRMPKSGDNVRFQLLVNGEVRGSAGLESLGVLTVVLNWVRRDLAAASRQ